MHPITIMLIAQSAIGITDGAGKAIDFDLKRMPAQQGCTANGTDIIVCGAIRRPPLQKLPDIEIAGPPRAEMKLFGDVKASAELESSSVGGFPSNRAMVKLRVPF